MFFTRGNMKHILSSLFLVVSGLALSASAGPSDFQVSQDDLKALENLLLDSDLQQEALTDDDFDDDGDEPLLRGWNPITWVRNQFRNRCVCENDKCDCCFKFKLFNSKACLSAEQLLAEKKVQISFSIDEKSLVNKQFDLKTDEKVCGTVPVPSLSFLKFCFTQQSDVEESGAITSCSNIDFKVGGTTGAVIQFRCLELKDGKITFGGYKELEKSQMLVIKAKNPFKAAVQMYRKATGKNN